MILGLRVVGDKSTGNFGSDGRESTCNARDPGSIPGSGISEGEGNGYLFQCSCLETSTDRGAWWTTVQGHKELNMTE